MIREALELIQETAVEATEARILTIPGDPKTVLVQHGKELIERPVPPPPRNHKVGSVDDLIELAKDLDSGDPSGNNRSVVWHSYGKVVLVFNGDDRREIATLPLEYSEQYALLASSARSQWVTQKDLIQLLRIDLKGAINVPDLIDNLRKIKFRVSSSGDSNVQHGNESLGKSVEAEVSGTDAIPETLIVNVKVYRNLGETERFAIECALDIDVHEQRFRFRPMADEIELARQQAQGSIRSRLDESLPEGVNVYFGEP